MHRLPVFFLIAIIAIVAVGLGLATAIVIHSHGYLLDPDGRAHVQALTGLNYGVVVTPVPTRKPTATPPPTPKPSPKPTPSPVPVTIPGIIDAAFCGGHVVSCADGKQAERVATCISGEMPGKINQAGGMGLFGLRASTWAMSPEAMQSPFNPSANAKAAFWLFQKSGHSWYRWGNCGV